MAAVQLNSQADVAENLGVCDTLVAEAASAGARAIFLPEGFAFLGPETDKGRFAEKLGDFDAPIQGALREWARRHRSYICAGGFPERSDDPARPHNTWALVDPSGALVGTYRKIHLFEVDLPDGTKLRESSGTTAGTEALVVPLDGFRLAPSICYDVRFPELYRRYVDQGASLLSVPAAFTATTGAAHWHVLLRARAIESQCWLVAPAQWGEHPRGRKTFGHTVIIDPWGTIQAELETGVGVISHELSLDEVNRVRRQLPALAHRIL